MKIKWIKSVKNKMLLVMLAFFICSIGLFYFLYMKAADIATNSIYEKMTAQAGFYLSGIDQQIESARLLQSEVFSDRKLSFLVEPGMLSEYERREALLTEMDRMFSIKSSGQFIKEVIMYVLPSQYKIADSGIKKWNEEEVSELLPMLQKGAGLYFENGDLFLISAGTSQAIFESTPNLLSVIYFDIEKIRQSLAGFNQIEGSGTFLFEKESGLMIHAVQDNMEMADIEAQLSRNADGKINPVQKVVWEGRDYLVSVADSDYLGLFVQYYPVDAVLETLKEYQKLFWGLLVIFIMVSVAFSIYSEQLFHKPLKKLLSAFGSLEKGDFDTKIRHNSEDEFGYLYDGFNHMTTKIKDLIQQVWLQNELTQKAELRQLQAQINPHFLYNSFFALSRRIKRGDMEGAEIFANHLGTYFRFLTRNENDDVKLSEEIEHARCYTDIQAVRFARRIRAEFGEWPGSCASVRVPRLILQPLIENAFQHGLENKVQDGLLRVRFEETPDQINIIIEDNGEELTDEKLEALRLGLTQKKEPEQENKITGLFNIHKRLQIYYHNLGGLKLSRSKLGGLCVTVCLPLGQEDDIA